MALLDNTPKCNDSESNEKEFKFDFFAIPLQPQNFFLTELEETEYYLAMPNLIFNFVLSVTENSLILTKILQVMTDSPRL